MKISSIFKAFLLTSLVTFSSLKSLIPYIEVRKRGDQTLIILRDAHIFNYANRYKSLIKFQDEIMHLEFVHALSVLHAVNDSKLSKGNFIGLHELNNNFEYLFKEIQNFIFFDEITKNKKELGKILSNKLLSKCIHNLALEIKNNLKLNRAYNALVFLAYLFKQNGISTLNIDVRFDLNSMTVVDEIEKYNTDNQILNRYFKQCIEQVKKSKLYDILRKKELVKLLKLFKNKQDFIKEFNNFNVLFEAKLVYEIYNCEHKIIFIHCGSHHADKIIPYLDILGFKKIDQLGNFNFLEQMQQSKIENEQEKYKWESEIILKEFNQAKQLDIYNFLMKHLAPEKPQIKSKL